LFGFFDVRYVKDFQLIVFEFSKKMLTMEYLRQNGDSRSEVVQSDVGNVDAVYHDAASSRLDQPEQAQGQGRLARPCPSHNAHLQEVHTSQVTVIPLPLKHRN
jgi:hypothetical protein